MVESSENRNRRDIKATGKLIALAVLGILLLVFMGANSERVEVNLLLFQLDTRLFVTLIGTALVGVVIGFLLAKVLDRRDRR